MKKTQLRLAIPMAVLTTLALAGCSDDSESDPTDGESTSAAASPGAGESTAPEEEPDLGPEPPRVRGGAGAVADVELGECPVEEGDQTASGTVTNSTDSATSYLIVINWINDTSSVRGRGFTVVRNLAAGESADWELDGAVVGGATQCALNVMRGRIG